MQVIRSKGIEELYKSLLLASESPEILDVQDDIDAKSKYM